MNKQLFITATDTGVGKTLVSGLLLSHLLGKGINAGYQKWAATGVDDTVADLDRVRQLAGLTRTAPEPLDLQVPIRFPLAASPHLAAEQAGQTIEPKRIVEAYEAMREHYEVLLVEGVGGLMVPLTRKLLLADLLSELKIPTLLVARTGLGTLNHTLLTLEALQIRDIPVLGVLFNDGPEEDETIASDNLQTIAAMARVEAFGRLPYRDNDEALRSAFALLGDNIQQSL